MFETKTELLGIIFALRQFRYYLYGKKFELRTDHRALSFIHTQKELNPMLQAWFKEILELDFEIIHIHGVANILPDALSRLYDADDEKSASNQIIAQNWPRATTGTNE